MKLTSEINYLLFAAQEKRNGHLAVLNLIIKKIHFERERLRVDRSDML